MVIPFYISFSQDEFADLDGGSAGDRRDAIVDALETASRPVVDIDAFFGEVAEELAEFTDESTASRIVFGAADWDGEDVTDGMRINTPDQVASLAAVLDGLSLDDFTHPDEVEALSDFYMDAARRGDAVAVYLS